jgi:predicted DNA-binding transcriptional regulator AlpA
MENSKTAQTEGKPGYKRGPAAAEYVGISHSSFRNYVKSGLLPQPVRPIPRRPVWRVSDLDAFLASL